MANDMEFTISAKDQASKAVETVKKKLQNFGSDLAKMALGFAAPLALAQTAFSAIGDAIEAHKKKVQDAIDNTAALAEKAGDLGVSVEEYQKLSNAADKAGMSIDKVAKAYTEVQKLLAGATGDGNSTAKMLETLGFAADDIAKGLVKPMDVIEKLGQAMLGAKDDSTAFKIATAVLGDTLAKDLLPQLKAAMDLAAGFSEESGISKEEAELIRQKKVKEKQAKNREEAQIARQEAATEFLKTDPEGQRIIAREQANAARKAQAGGGASAVVLGTETIAGMKEVQDEVMRILKARADAEKERLRIANEAKANEIIAAAEAIKAEEEAQAIADKAIEDAMTQAEKDDKKAREDSEKETKKDKDDARKEAEKAAQEKAKKEKDDLGKALDEEAKARADAEKDAGKMTLSSLREIGGGLAGEALVNNVDIQRETLDIQNKILIELQKLNVKTLQEAPPSTDFTKSNIA
ncbi:hypothetical protein UFOVP779_36 [uncultured Caudovirales phage]|uniref:Uncharacterized protein n=1 Tax=uncultured Caudovirales phage TaxID=2100421 RepID=A0A6J5NUB8_9CAUD|nr:hypothetical protein UFOVP779_36 [uncultured Caudovirales phage]